MMHKRTKNIYTLMIAALFLLSIGYFAVLPPTSAYFYDYKEYQKNFTFGTLSLNPTFQASESIDLQGATILEDPEEILFDEVVHIVTVSAQNTGSLPARVYLTVNANLDLPNGLHYFFYEDLDSGTSIKQKISAKSIVTANNKDATYLALKSYNLGDGISGGNPGRYIVVQPSSTKDLKVAFWVDYDAVSATLNNTSSVTQLNYSGISITLHAVQNTDGAFTRTY